MINLSCSFMRFFSNVDIYSKEKICCIFLLHLKKNEEESSCIYNSIKVKYIGQEIYLYI